MSVPDLGTTVRDASRDSVRALVEAVRGPARGRSAELFLRVAERIRVGGADGRDAVSRIAERGLAVRVASGRDGRKGFAATTSLDPDAIVSATRMALDNPVEDPIAIVDRPADLADDGEPATLPDPEDVHRWRQELDERVRDVGGPRVRIVEATVVVASMVEVVATSAGAVLRRFRRRSWAAVEVVATGSRGAARRAVVRAAPAIDGLPALDGVEGWAAALVARVHGPEPPTGDLPWRLAPAAAGTLVRAAAQALHVGSDGGRFPVGEGWALTEDPNAAEAITGGSFDDVGHSTRRTLVSDGKNGFRVVFGPGHAWRASFRDPPSHRPAHLGVDPSGQAPDRAIDVLDLKILPLDGGVWVLEGLARYPDGSGGIVRHQSRPAEIVARCLAAVGQPRPTADDVTTPALVLAF